MQQYSKSERLQRRETQVWQRLSALGSEWETSNTYKIFCEARALPDQIVTAVIKAYSWEPLVFV